MILCYICKGSVECVEQPFVAVLKNQQFSGKNKSLYDVNFVLKIKSTCAYILEMAYNIRKQMKKS